MPKINDYSLYLVISEEYSLGRNAVEVARQAISGGVDIIQMREKHKTAGELIALARELSGLCKESGVTFIVNDDPLVAKESNADGLHLGQEDMRKYSIASARSIIGNVKIIGVSTHSLAQVIKADKSGVDYIAYGPIFPTQTKDYFLGTGEIKEVLRSTEKPVVFIGGINLSNVDEILSQGGKSVALIRDIIQAKDVGLRAKSFKHKLIKENRAKDR